MQKFSKRRIPLNASNIANRSACSKNIITRLNELNYKGSSVKL